jgi:hypothetical protein
MQLYEQLVVFLAWRIELAAVGLTRACFQTFPPLLFTLLVRSNVTSQAS